MNFTKQAESLIIALNNDATGIVSKLRKIHSEMYVVKPNLEEMESTLNNVEELLKVMGRDVRSLICNINKLKEEQREKEVTL